MDAELSGAGLAEAGIVMRMAVTALGSSLVLGASLVLAATWYAGPPVATPTAFCELLARFSLLSDACLISTALDWVLLGLLGCAVVAGLAAGLPGVAETVPVGPGLTIFGIMVLTAASRAGAYDALKRRLTRDGASAHDPTLAQVGARFDLATRAAGVGVYEFDLDGDVVWWNDVMYDIFGRTKQDFAPSVAAWRGLIHAEDLPLVQRLLGESERTQESLDLRFRGVRPDGSIRHLQTTLSLVAGDSLRSRRRIGVLLDVTDRIESERRERALEVQLRESFHQAGIAETANGVLQSVEQALSGVGVAASVMRRDLTALRPERVEQVASLIASHRVDIAAFLTEDVRGKYLPDYLLAIAQQLTANSSSLESELGEINRHVRHLRDIISAQQSLIPMGGTWEPTDLRDLIEVALLVQAPDFAEIETQRIFEDLPLVLTDRHKLLQIIVCYVSNARDAMLLGGAAPPRIVLRLQRDGEHAVFSIQDTGPGMSQETLSHLWEFGFTTKRNGHGFGLHASAKAARDIGAILHAESPGLGGGACFSVRLPLGGPAARSTGLVAAGKYLPA